MPRGGILEELQSVDALALERVRTGARFERATAHHRCTAGGHCVGGRIHLRFRFDGARSGDHLHGRATQRNAAHADHGAGPVPFPRDQFVWLDDVHRALDAGQRVEHLRVEFALVADGADQRALGAAGNVDAQARGAYPCLDCRDFRVAGIRLHDDDHYLSPRVHCIEVDGSARPKTNRATFLGPPES